MIEIRACAVADAVAVSTLLGDLGYVVPVSQVSEHIRRLAGTGSDPVFLAVLGGQIVGLLAAHLCQMLQYERPVMRVTALVVDRRARRCGVGKRLMQHAEQVACEVGCGFIELTSAVGRTDAHAFYHHIGYEPNSLRFSKRAVRRKGIANT
jgi:GNAT superfamily N-acetyltransferase